MDDLDVDLTVPCLLDHPQRLGILPESGPADHQGTKAIQ